MTLFSSLQIANNALIASQLGIQVAGNNIANANTPGYVRERLVLAPAPTQRYGGLLLGLGVDVEAVVQQTDRFLESRLRAAGSDVAESEAQEQAYVQLEALIGELSDTDLSTSLTSFFNSIHDVLNQPDSVSVRNLVVLQGRSLSDNVNRLDGRVREVRRDLDVQIADTAGQINSLTKAIAKLNSQITAVEGGGTSPSDAIGLRDSRSIALSELAKLIDIQAFEQTTGDVTVFSGGDYLVFQGTSRDVGVVQNSDRGQAISAIHLVDTDAPIVSSGGRLGGLTQARDGVLGGFIDRLDSFANTLIFEFNKIHAGGQGLSGLSTATSEFAVSNTQAALDSAGLPFVAVNGGFQVLVRNEQTGVTTTRDIRVDLNGLDGDTSLDDLAAQIDAIDGLSATINSRGQLSLQADSSTLTFAFANDTSGVLAALGVNTFFRGKGASDMGVQEAIAVSPARFAASRGGIDSDTANGEALANLLTASLRSQGGASLATIYDRFVGEVTQGAEITRSVASGHRTFYSTLEGQLLAISGVNIDEEAIRLVAFQRAFQASARVVATISDLLETLINL
jgi:flagellar hook-associated protein 1 FlgK